MCTVVREELDKAMEKWMEEQEKYEESQLGTFRRIYPREDSAKYDKYFQSSGSLYQETAAFKARSECARWGLCFIFFLLYFYLMLIISIM